MGLNCEDRVNAIAQFRYTERQARFLELVLRHGGVCVPRQYATVAGIANGGEKCTALFEKLVSRHHAVASDCRHNRARVYHVHYQRLYAAIGEPDIRNVQLILGHADIKQTQRYLNITDEELQRAMTGVGERRRQLHAVAP